MKISFKILVKISLILIFTVILAGSVVRMTGSGMGCPDWPKCFGYLIPPTERSQLEWKKSHRYKKGEIIIKNKTLRLAKNDFVSSGIYEEKNWSLYTKHDYADFNVSHTWIEYINRLLGALSGVAILFMTISSIKFYKINKKIILISILVLFGLIFEAWLGKEVVDSNLKPFKVSIHLVVALIIVFGLTLLTYLTDKKIESIKTNPIINKFSILLLVMTFFEIILGIQVREFVDSKIDLKGNSAMKIFPFEFDVHRSFSLLIVGLNIYFYRKLKKMKLVIPIYNFILFLIGLEVIIGILMYYFSFPFLSQPLHLLVASVLFASQSFVVFKLNIKK
ncbi:MAG: heme A synthase [Flavobacteriaceae bacterium]|nr:heme A synthase [Flavobacteriaceae bacterium]|tara:strand:- start:2493 stop:3497 length:1005 start_codon:yes stop_codon:yes gene_type:complete